MHQTWPWWQIQSVLKKIYRSLNQRLTKLFYVTRLTKRRRLFCYKSFKYLGFIGVFAYERRKMTIQTCSVSFSFMVCRWFSKWRLKKEKKKKKEKNIIHPAPSPSGFDGLPYLLIVNMHSGKHFWRKKKNYYYWIFIVFANIQDIFFQLGIVPVINDNNFE